MTKLSSRASRFSPSRLGGKTPIFPTAINFVIREMATGGESQAAMLNRIVLLRPNPLDPSKDQLFLDQTPIPRDAWSFNSKDRNLNWRGAFGGGGHLHLTPDGLGAMGNIGSPRDTRSVIGETRIEFNCDVAPNCGVAYISSGRSMTDIEWDPDSDLWKNADWARGKNRLKLIYTVFPRTRFDPAALSFEFHDTQATNDMWSIGKDANPGFIEISKGKGGEQIYLLTFKNPGPPLRSVYPSWMIAHEDLFLSNIDGALQINIAGSRHEGIKHELWGLKGVSASPMNAGYYRTSSDAAPFAIFDGSLVIGGKPVAHSRLSGSLLTWNNLDLEHQKRTGLPENGSLLLNQAGASAAEDPSHTKAHKLATSDAIDAIAKHSDLHGDVHKQVVAIKQSLGDGQLDIRTLQNIKMYNEHNEDVIQAALTQDLSQIKQSRIPTDLWRLMFATKQQPTLTDELAAIASTAVVGGPDPTDWYKSLATASLTSGLANGDDENCKLMNGPRASQWLQTQMANSKVYYQHSQLLFHYEWKKKFEFTQSFLDDQKTVNPEYDSDIDSIVSRWVAEINKINDPSGTVKSKLIQQVTAVGEHAKTEKLYWAFMYHYWVTSPTALGQYKFLVDSEADDGSAITRVFQQHMAVLTALDNSGYMAKQFISRVNEFLAFNILTTQFDFQGSVEDFDIVKQFLQTFVKNNLESGDADIKAAAQKLHEALLSGKIDPFLRTSLFNLAAYAKDSNSSWAFPDIMESFDESIIGVGQQYLEGFDTHIIRGIGSLIVGGLVAMNIFSVVTSFMRYNKLSPAHKAQVDILAAEMGVKIVAGVIKGSVRFAAIFDRTLFDSGACAHLKMIVEEMWKEDYALESGLLKMGMGYSRWCGDTEGTAGIDATKLIWNEETETAEEIEVLVDFRKVFGDNLDTFVTTRLGPLFMLAGIGLSIYFMVEGESGTALASDILNIVGSSLAIFADVGSWAVPAVVNFLATLPAETSLLSLSTEAAEAIIEAFSTVMSWAGPLAIVAALAGAGLLLYELFKHQPSPVEEFVNGYVKKDGFYVPSKASSIDYVFRFQNVDQNNLMMIGFSLFSTAPSVADRKLMCNPDGSISLSGKDDKTRLPDTVWQVQTDAFGISKIAAVVKGGTQEPVPLLLSLMSDDTVSFQPKMPKQSVTEPARLGLTIVTQTWRSDLAPGAQAKLTGDGKFMASLSLTFQPVKPTDTPGAASDQWLVCRNEKVLITKLASSEFSSHLSELVFDLRMSGMAPCYMTMQDLRFAKDTKVEKSTFGPSFAVTPSTALTYTCDKPLPSFLIFRGETGKITVDVNKKTAAMPKTEYVLTAVNTLGTEQAKFHITVD